MSTLYEVEIASVDGPEVELFVRSLQPESAPLYTTERFALALLCGAPGYEESALAAELPPDAVIAVSEGNVDPSPYVASVTLEAESDETGRYCIVVTDSAWVSFLEPGEYASVAWDDISDVESVFGPEGSDE